YPAGGRCARGPIRLRQSAGRRIGPSASRRIFHLRIPHRFPRHASARRGDPVRPAAGHAPTADELEAWARHAHAANGFGDAILLANPTSRRSSMAVPQSIMQPHVDSTRYAKCIEASRRIRWDIDRDVIRNREFDFTKKFLPDGLSYVDRLHFLGADERRLLSQIQGRSYANIFGLVERYIAAKVLEVSRDHWLGDQTALEALVRFSDEELKHQALFRRIETMTGAGMPPGYAFLPRPDEVASVVLG